MLAILISTVVILSVAVIALSVRILLKKDGSFLHKCAMSEIDMGDGEAHSCGHCTLPEGGKHEDCPRFNLHHGNIFTQTEEAIKMIDNDKEK